MRSVYLGAMLVAVMGMATLFGAVPLCWADYVYWTSRGASPYDNGTIYRYNTDNGTTATAAQPGYGTYALHVTDDYIYFTSYVQDAVRRCDLDGTGVTTLVSGTNSPAGVYVTDQYIYWSNRNDGDINRADLDGSNATTLYDGSTYPLDLWVAGSYIYWADDAEGSEGIWRCGLDGSGVTHLVDTATQLAQPNADPWGICVTDQYIYMAVEEHQSIQRCDLDGTNLTGVVTALSYPVGVGVNDTNIYWVSAGDLELKRSTLAGASVTTIVSSGATPKYVRVVASEQSGQLQ